MTLLGYLEGVAEQADRARRRDSIDGQKGGFRCAGHQIRRWFELNKMPFRDGKKLLVCIIVVGVLWTFHKEGRELSLFTIVR